MWTHYLVVLFVPLAVAHRRAGAAWLATIAYWISPLEPPLHVWKIVFVLLLTATLSVLAARRARPETFARQPAGRVPLQAVTRGST